MTHIYKLNSDSIYALFNWSYSSSALHPVSTTKYTARYFGEPPRYIMFLLSNTGELEGELKGPKSLFQSHLIAREILHWEGNGGVHAQRIACSSDMWQISQGANRIFAPSRLTYMRTNQGQRFGWLCLIMHVLYPGVTAI